MTRFLPRSLAGRMALLLGLALLVAQLLNFALILNERQKLGLAQSQGPALVRFAEVAADLIQAPPPSRDAAALNASRRGARFVVRSGSGVAEDRRSAALEARLGNALRDEGIEVAEVRAATIARRALRLAGAPERQVLRLAARLDDGRWLAARIATPPRDPLLIARLAAATLLVYAIVLGASVWIALRLARPLRDLTRAAESFGGRGPPPSLEPRGPDDLKGAMAAFNAMNARLVALLDEKDRMLGAIGHDLRTPLASLRIQLEDMTPEEDREAAVAKLTEITDMLEDILALARSGRARERARRVDLSALVDALVEERRALGHDVAYEPGGRRVAAVQPGLVRRAVDNLLDNAVRYAGSARVSVRDDAGGVAIEVADEGPGIPPGELERVLEPFHRLEGSRSRHTGGSGLGLAIARSVAQSHGGRIELAPALPSGRGLRATLVLPA